MLKVLQWHNCEDIRRGHDRLLQLLEDNKPKDEAHNDRDHHVGDKDYHIEPSEGVEVVQSIACYDVIQKRKGVMNEVIHQIDDVLHLLIVNLCIKELFRPSELTDPLELDGHLLSLIENHVNCRCQATLQ